MYNCKYPHLFSPITLAGTVFRNRIFGSPTGTANLTGRHYPKESTFAYYGRKAQGGAASVCVGDCVVSEDARMNDGHIALWDEKSYISLYNLADAITRHGAVASIELSHSGSHSHASAADGAQLYGPMEYVNDAGRTVLPMTEENIWEAIEKHARAAALAKRSGFGMVTIHGGHGWLITEFMSPVTNKRTDKWGGSPEGRCRFAVETCKAVRKAVGPNFPIEMRISGSECNPGGYGIEEGIEIAKQLDGHLDLIHVSAGSHEVWDVFTVTHPDMFLPDGVNVKYAAEIKKHVKHTAIAAVGALSDPELMEEIVASGQADVVEVARGLIADPDLPKKAREGRAGDINKCMRCLACFSSLMTAGNFICAINPEIGREQYVNTAVPVIKSDKSRRVLVAGGGIAGMRAALTANARGHRVVLCEKSERLGGVLRCEDGVDFKRNLSAFLDNQERAVLAAGIDVRLETPATPQLAGEIAPEAIIAAVGARPVTPKIPGIEHAVGAERVYLDVGLAGESAVILGGGLVGAELAIHLARLGRKVTLVEMLGGINDGGNMLQGLAIRLELARLGITALFDTRAIEILPGAVKAGNATGSFILTAQTTIYAVGQAPRDESAEALRFLAPEFHRIGDCLAPKNIAQATRMGYNIAAAL